MERESGYTGQGGGAREEGQGETTEEVPKEGWRDERRTLGIECELQRHLQGAAERHELQPTAALDSVWVDVGGLRFMSPHSCIFSFFQ